MSEENKTVELQDEDTEKVVGGGLTPGNPVTKQWVYKSLKSKADYGYVSMPPARVLSDPGTSEVKFRHGMLKLGKVNLLNAKTIELRSFRNVYDYKNPILMDCTISDDN